MTLSAKKCIPCQGGIDPMTEVEAQRFLESETPEWELLESARILHRQFTFRNFADALAFTNKVGAVAEEEGHHPDIGLGWGYCDIRIQTHKINGLHENDFILAAKIDTIAP